MKNDNIKQSLIAAVAAILLSSTAIGAAVGPARAIETGPSLAAAAGPVA